LGLIPAIELIDIDKNSLCGSEISKNVELCIEISRSPTFGNLQ
jgi:hypothetical protein